jgi:type IV pilus assembly protein PilN
MKIAVNLASHPYVELRPVYSRLRTWIAILALTGGALWYLYRNERVQAEATQARVTAVETQVRELESQQQDYQKMMREPKDAAILQQSEFLNGLFQRKAFSWTATMTDLETVLPTGVQVMSIDPIVAPDGHMMIRLRVTGERARAIDLTLCVAAAGVGDAGDGPGQSAEREHEHGCELRYSRGLSAAAAGHE